MKKISTLKAFVDEYAKYAKQDSEPTVHLNDTMIRCHSIETCLYSNDIMLRYNDIIIAVVRNSNIQTLWFDNDHEIIEYTAD